MATLHHGERTVGVHLRRVQLPRYQLPVSRLGSTEERDDSISHDDFSVLLRASVESHEGTCRISQPWAVLLLSFLVGWSNTRLPRQPEPAGPGHGASWG